MPIASTQTQEGGCTPHWRRLFRALYTVISPGLETGDWRLETGDWRLETGDWRLETGDWRLETD